MNETQEPHRGRLPASGRPESGANAESLTTAVPTWTGQSPPPRPLEITLGHKDGVRPRAEFPERGLGAPGPT